jgi:hypothetical protein
MAIRGAVIGCAGVKTRAQLVAEDLGAESSNPATISRWPVFTCGGVCGGRKLLKQFGEVQLLYFRAGVPRVYKRRDADEGMLKLAAG